MGPNWYHSHWHDDDDLGALRRCRPAQNVDNLNGVQNRKKTQKKKKNDRNKMTTLYQNLLEKSGILRRESSNYLAFIDITATKNFLGQNIFSGVGYCMPQQIFTVQCVFQGSDQADDRQLKTEKNRFWHLPNFLLCLHIHIHLFLPIFSSLFYYESLPINALFQLLARVGAK
jgi:hypothetical protein